MKKSNYKKFSDLSLDELENLVEELETLSIKALKERKKTLRTSILRSVKKAIKDGFFLMIYFKNYSRFPKKASKNWNIRMKSR